MPVPTKMGVSLTTEKFNDIDRALDTIIEILNGHIAINLTKEERSGIQSVAEKRLPYVQKAFDSLIPDNPKLVPNFSDPVEGNADYAYLSQLNRLRAKILQVAEIQSDHELAAGFRAYEFMRDFYDSAKRAAERNVPGADTVVDELSPLFDQANPAAPTTPTV